LRHEQDQLQITEEPIRIGSERSALRQGDHRLLNRLLRPPNRGDSRGECPERVAIPRLELRALLRSEFIQKFHTVLGRIILDPRLRLREAASNPSPIEFRGSAIQDAGVPAHPYAPR